jgi:putative lipoprotein
MNTSAAGIAGRIFAAGLCLSILACGGEKMAADGTTASAKIEGVVVYRERIALPPTAEIEIVFEDVSRPDAPATVLSTLIMEAKNGPPYAFAIDYDTAQIDSRMTYALRATIRVDGEMKFTTMDYTNPFSGNPVTVLVRMVPGKDSEG